MLNTKIIENSELFCFDEYLSLYYSNSKYGIMLNTGEFLTQPKFDNISDISFEFCYQLLKQYHIKNIDLTKYKNNYKFDNNYDGISIITNEYTYKKRFFDFNNNILLTPIIFDDTSILYKGFAKVHINGKWGIINNIGNFIIKLLYYNIDFLYDYDIFLTKTNIFDKSINFYSYYYGLVDKKGELLLEPKYDMNYINNYLKNLNRKLKLIFI